ncbi:hypothetical protein NGM10_13470 [Halorussus salilacus]|uniref:hypothetical protein n=1 Tax=Halorussus salilacus TaxID=2953750 RepID=UPI00209DE456|nr:hypothetical protein [Halorussus salilacus]USZ67731.1 hypothetical protein NGM10_13470 [Halorussus salilacus]
MVAPPNDEDKRAAVARLKLGGVLLVGVSAGLIAVSGDGSPVEIGVAVVVGLAVGAALLLYLSAVM